LPPSSTETIIISSKPGKEEETALKRHKWPTNETQTVDLALIPVA